MRVLLGVHRFPPTAWGGTEVYTLELARSLSARGHAVTVLTCAPGDSGTVKAHQEEYEGLPVWRMAFDLEQAENPILEEYANARVADALQDRLAEERPDVVHLTHCGYLSTAPLVVARAQGIPAIVTLTDFWALCPNGLLVRSDRALCSGPAEPAHCVRCYAHMGPRGARYAAASDRLPLWAWRMALAASGWSGVRAVRYGRWLQALAQRQSVIRERLGQAAAILCPSRFLRAMLVRHGYPAERLHHAPHGIVQPEMLRRTTPLAAAPVLRLGFIGPLAEHKGAHLAQAAFAGLPAGTPARLTYWGSLPEPAAPEAFGAQLLAQIARTPQVVHRGPYARAAVRQVFEELDVLLVPSLCYENTPTVIYEALASGMPVIASDQGGMRELIEEYRGGWLFPRGDVTALQTLIARLAHDREAVRRVAAGIRPVPTFAAHGNYVADLYRHILESAA